MRRNTDVEMGLLTIAGLLLSFSFVFSAPESMARTTYVMLGNALVGVSAGVPENKYNILAQELQKKEDELLAREEKLARNESNTTTFSLDQVLPLASFFMSLFLFALVGFNFYLDYRRGVVRTNVSSVFSVNLRR